MPIISARNLSKTYGPQTLLDNVTFTVRSGERVGLLGKNGEGKSTLLRILAGLETADQGTIERRREAKVRYLAQEPELDANATPRSIVQSGLLEWQRAVTRFSELSGQIGEQPANHKLLEEQAELSETIERLGGWSREHVVEQMLEHLRVRDIDRPVGTMSGGERRRVALAELLVSAPALAILDEPTNHLDTETIEWLELYLADEFKGAVLMVTHDRYVLDAVADRVFELANGKITEFQGGYADYLEQKAELVAHAERVEQNRLNLLRRERAWLLRGAKARTTKQKARINRARALLDADPLQKEQTVELAGLERGAQRTGKTIVDFEQLGIEIAGRTLIHDLTLRLTQGERVGIVGPNGVGKTSLLRAVAGELVPSAGKLVLGTNTRIAYFDQSRTQMRDDWSVFDNVAEREGAEKNGAGVVQIGDRTLSLHVYLEQFLFEGSKQRQKVGALSGGERARVALAKALKTGANLLLLDEPTNDLDVATLGALEQLLESWPGCAFIVSHDRYFLDRVATSILAFEGGSTVTRYPGNYSTYVSLRPSPSAKKASVEPPPPAPAATREAPPAEGPKPLSFAERKELGGIMDEISNLEQRVSELQDRLADPKLYGGPPEHAARVRLELAAAEAALTEKTQRWEDLESRKDIEPRDRKSGRNAR